RSMGTEVIPFLEKEWMKNSLVPLVRTRIEDIIHDLQYELLKEKLAAWKEGGAEDLLEGMMLVANYQYPDLNIAFLRRRIEQLYFDLWAEFNGEMTPLEQVKVMNHIMFHKLKFKANSK